MHSSIAIFFLNQLATKQNSGIISTSFNILNHIFFSASKPTLAELQSKLLKRISDGVLATEVFTSTNNNSAKPDILHQIFKDFIINNRTTNGKQKDIIKSTLII